MSAPSLLTSVAITSSFSVATKASDTDEDTYARLATALCALAPRLSIMLIRSSSLRTIELSITGMETSFTSADSDNATSRGTSGLSFKLSAKALRTLTSASRTISLKISSAMVRSSLLSLPSLS